MDDVVTTCVLHHPLRPMRCLHRALLSLDEATMREHHVEVIVQGPVMDGAQLPSADMFKNIRLEYFYNIENLGNSIPLRHSIARFLKTGHTWWAKCDDDMSFDDGGWDLAINTLLQEDKTGEYKCGCSMIGVPKHMWSGKPRNFYRQKRDGRPDILKWKHSGYAVRNPDGYPEYVVCDFADHGCTVFARDVFTAGCLPDERLFTGGVDFDLGLSMLEQGFKSILITNPRCRHHHGECKPWKYGVIRYDRESTNRSGAILRDKWGVDIEMLTGFKGLPQFAPPKNRTTK